MNINKSFPCEKSNYREKRKDSIKYIVIHYVGAQGGAKNNAKYYSTARNVGASAHYFVGHASEGAEIYQSVPEACCAWHCGSETGKYFNDCRNDNSIGIEMCCHLSSGGWWFFDDATVDNTVELTKELMTKHGIPVDRVVRHYDVTRKICPAPFVNDEEAWKHFKERLTEMKELTSENDIVWELHHRGIITEKDLWLKKLSEDSNAYWLARKCVNYIRERDAK